MLSVSSSPRGVKHTPNRDRFAVMGAGGTAAWGGISGTLSAQTDLQAALDAKQDAVVSFVAGENLSGDRAVYIADDGLAYHADKNSATAIRAIGLTTGAVSMGGTATIQVEGIYTEATWSWAGNAVVWLSTTGQLTQTPPTTGYLVRAGIPAGPTRILIEPQFVAQL